MSTPPFTPPDNAGLPTFGQAKAGAIKNVLISCNNSPEGMQLVNDATERLLYRGDFPGTVLPIQIQVNQNVTTFPRIVGSVRNLRLCNHNVPVWNQWYRFLPHRWGGPNLSLFGVGGCCGNFLPWLGGPAAFSEYGRSPTFAPIPTANCVIRAYSILDDDGAIIQLFGFAQDGVTPLRTDNGDGTWSDGIKLVLNNPVSLDTVGVGRITRVIKPFTQGQVQLTAFDTVTSIETSIANYDPSETLPNYIQYRLTPRVCSPATTTLSAIALVKLAFIPVQVDSDPILIPNLHALKLMIQAIRREEANDDAGAQAKINAAVRELNIQYSDDNQYDQIPVDVNPFGTASPGRAGVGQLL